VCGMMVGAGVVPERPQRDSAELADSLSPNRFRPVVIEETFRRARSQ
jgi:hypothetical protein